MLIGLEILLVNSMLLLNTIAIY